MECPSWIRISNYERNVLLFSSLLEHFSCIHAPLKRHLNVNQTIRHHSQAHRPQVHCKQSTKRKIVFCVSASAESRPPEWYANGKYLYVFNKIMWIRCCSCEIPFVMVHMTGREVGKKRTVKFDAHKLCAQATWSKSTPPARQGQALAEAQRISMLVL